MAGAFILPIAWLFYIFIQGAFTHWYPYPFLDVTKIGLGAALFNAVLVLVVAAVLAVIFKLIDAKIPSVLADSAAERVEAPSPNVSAQA